jgi:glutathione S-transferase
MITLYGLPISNYYNKVKLVLLEKGIPFTEERVGTGSSDEAVLAATPLGKIPFIRDSEAGGQPLCESQVIVDYLEARWPAPPLVPADPFAAAKVRELATFMDLHVELVARELYGQAFFGRTASDEAKARVQPQLVRHLAAFKRLAKFAPYAAGDTFTLADASVWPSLPLVAMATRAVLGEDLVAAAGIDWRSYVKFAEQRPTVAKVAADRKAAQAEMAAAKKSG